MGSLDPILDSLAKDSTRRDRSLSNGIYYLGMEEVGVLMSEGNKINKVNGRVSLMKKSPL